MNKRRVVASLVSAMTLVLVLVAWVAFAPTRLGGQASYVIVNGNSMEPGIHRGDLAVVRQSRAYAEGDVVTYRHPDLGPVIHRIIGRDSERFVVKGDHNNFIDGFQPAQSDFIGKLWFHVPTLGRLIAPFQIRRNAVFLLFVAIVAVGGGAGAAANRSKHYQGSRPDRPALERRTIMQVLSRIPEDALVGFAATTLALLVLAVLAFARSDSRRVPDEITYTQSGAFTYSATSSDGEIYDSAAATTGDPIFRRLTDSVAVRFDYAFATERPADVRGVQRLVAEVSEVGGWKRTIELQPPAPFRGTAFSSEGMLQLARVDALIQRFESETGVHSPNYTLTIAPRVELAGTLGDREIQDEFAPRLAFKLDPFQLSPPGASVSEPNPFAPSEASVSRGTRTESNTISLLLVTLGVPTARWVALVGLGTALACAGAFVILLGCRAAPAAGLPAHLQAGPGLSIVHARGLSGARGPVIDVTSVHDLAKVALRDGGGIILQETRPGYEGYFVQVGAVLYRYVAMDTAPKVRRGEAAA